MVIVYSLWRALGFLGREELYSVALWSPKAIWANRREFIWEDYLRGARRDPCSGDRWWLIGGASKEVGRDAKVWREHWRRGPL